MELRHLRYFIAVAEELHFTKAAKRLHIGQPPLSQQIQALEEELGIRLFERSKRKVELTPAGKHFLIRARQILSDTQTARDEVRRIAKGETGELRLGFTSSFPMTSILPKLLNDYRQHYPDVNLSLKEMYTTDQFEALLQKQLDVGIVRYNEPTPPDGIHMIHLRKDPLLLVIHEKHPLATLKTISLAQCKDESFIAYPTSAGTWFRRYVQRLCLSAGFEQRIVQDAGEALTKISLVAAGLGMTILPSPLDYVRIEGIRYIPISDPNAYLLMVAASRKDESSLLITRFLERLRLTIQTE